MKLLLKLMLAFCSVALASDDPARAQLDDIFPRSTVQIATPDARVHRFTVWVAADDARRSRGLMYVKHLEDNEGMLFVYPSPRPISMWMKNTYIPLDMIFVSADGRVSHVAHATQPHSLQTVDSNGPAVAVLEVKAGRSRELKIGPGAHVDFDAAR